MSGERKLTIKHPDGSVVEMPITADEAQGILAKLSGKSDVIREHSSKSKPKPSIYETFPTDEQIDAFLPKDRKMTVNEVGEHFFKRKINAHKETALWHRLYGAIRRVQEARATRS